MMSDFYISSILEINFYILIISFLWIIIKSEISFKYQRMSALLIPVLGMLVWAVKPLLIAKDLVYTSVVLAPINVIPQVSKMTNSVETKWNWPMIYIVISMILLAIFFYKIIRVLLFFKDSEKRESLFIKTSAKEDSFSFFNFIHLRDPMDEAEKQVVMQHELIHYQKRHSLDLVLLEIFHSLFWINPLFFYLKKEMVNIHEFEVDQEMYKTYKTNYMRHLLNYALGSVDSHYLLTSPFYNRLTITKRIQTMKTSKKTNSILLLTIPVFAIMLSVISCEKKTESPMSPPPPPIPQEHVQKGELTKEAEFPGGKEAMYAYMGDNIKYSKTAQEQGISGKVIIEFTIKDNGNVAFVNVIKGVSEELDKEAIRVIKHMPDWTPAEVDGKPVSSQLKLPIMFALD